MKPLVYLVALAIALGAYAQGKQPDAKEAARPAPGVNWQGQVIRATGAGAPDMKAANPAQARLGAEKAAQMDAFRNLLQQVKGIQITAAKTVGDAMSAQDEIRGRVEGVIRGYKITGKRYYSDSGVEIDVEVPLALLTEVLPVEKSGGPALKTDGERRNTGVVVDARGLSVSPALTPRLLDEGGKALYAAEYLSAEARKTATVAVWVKSLDEAKKHARVGDKPLVLKAAKAVGSDLILGGDDAKKLAESNNAYLAEGRVVIVHN